jgi:hypothetical protein
MTPPCEGGEILSRDFLLNTKIEWLAGISPPEEEEYPGLPGGGGFLPMQQLWQFAEVFGGKDGQRVIEPVVAQSPDVFLHFKQDAFKTAGTCPVKCLRTNFTGRAPPTRMRVITSGRPVRPESSGRVAEAHFGVGHYAEHKVVMAGQPLCPCPPASVTQDISPIGEKIRNILLFFERGVEQAVFFIHYLCGETG